MDQAGCFEDTQISISWRTLPFVHSLQSKIYAKMNHLRQIAD